MSLSHTPVMTSEILDLFAQTPLPHHFLDMTFGRGGHTRALLQHFPQSRVVALDRDPEAVAFSKETFSQEYPERFSMIEGRFSQLRDLLSEVDPFSGIVCDLGVSSPQLEDGQRGFSFMKEGPLDMRMDQKGRTAAQIVNRAPQRELADLFFHLGEEKFSRKIAEAIVKARTQKPFKTTTQLSAFISSVVFSRRIHPATRVFQALRMAVNEELVELSSALPQTLSFLKPEGCLAVISFHSLEDRIVKKFFQEHSRRSRGQLATPPFSRVSDGPVSPTSAEVKRNVRSRSAKLRWGFLHQKEIEQ